MPKTIILALDGSAFAERALAPAHTLSVQSGAALVTTMSRLGGATDPENSVNAAIARAGFESVPTVVFRDRLAAEAIPLLAETWPDPVICMATHARGGVGQAVFGSIAEAVLGVSDVPIVFVGPSATSTGQPRFRELIVCLDGSTTSAEIMPVAAAFALDLNLSLFLVGVVDPDSKPGRGSPVDADTFESASLERVAHDLKRTTGADANWETLHSHDAAVAIVDYARTLRAPLIAMTSHGRTGLSRVVAGSVTMSVVRQAPCPVLVTRSCGLH